MARATSASWEAEQLGIINQCEPVSRHTKYFPVQRTSFDSRCNSEAVCRETSFASSHGIAAGVRRGVASAGPLLARAFRAQLQTARPFLLSRQSTGATTVIAHDVLFLGGGLHSSLAALALCSERPELRVAIVEASPRIGGNHLWSFHAEDAPRPIPDWLAPTIAFRWDRYEVRFPNGTRVLESPYQTLTSTKLHDTLVSRFSRSDDHDLYLGRQVMSCTDHHATLDDGTELEASLILDGRGMQADAAAQGCGFQKFYGMELILSNDHDYAHPVLMDATVEQTWGFRFLYLLPFSPRRLFVEDTYFSESPSMDRLKLRTRVLSCAERRGLKVQRVGREEHGVLPMPWMKQPVDLDSVFSIGIRGGWYHPATAYSSPFAIQIALAAAACDSARDLLRCLRLLRKNHQKRARFARLLNWMLFQCYAPEQRLHVFEEFYRLPESTLRRFYSLQLTTTDRMRILSGRPPHGFSLGRAIHTMERRAK